MAAHKIIKMLEDVFEKNNSIKYDVYFARKIQNKEEIINLSLQNQILVNILHLFV